MYFRSFFFSKKAKIGYGQLCLRVENFRFIEIHLQSLLLKRGNKNLPKARFLPDFKAHTNKLHIFRQCMYIVYLQNSSYTHSYLLKIWVNLLLWNISSISFEKNIVFLYECILFLWMIFLWFIHQNVCNS